MLEELFVYSFEELGETPYQIYFRGIIIYDREPFKFDFIVTHLSKIETSFTIENEHMDARSYHVKKFIYKLLQSEYNKLEEQIIIADSASSIFRRDQVMTRWSSAIEALRRNIKQKESFT